MSWSKTSERRKKKSKSEKDRNQAIAILMALNDSGEIEAVRTAYHAMPKSWRRTIEKELLALGEEQIFELIKKTEEPNKLTNVED